MKRLARILMITAFSAFVSCGGGGTEPDPIAEGWGFFSSGQLFEAHMSFVTAVESGKNEGYIGLGWVCIDLDSLPESDRYFGIVSGDSLSDGYAGWSAVLWARANYAGCITKSDFVLRHEPNYQFTHRPAVNFQDLQWYQASSYLHQGNYSQCLLKIQQLDNNFTTDTNAANAGDVLASKLELLAGQLKKHIIQ